MWLESVAKRLVSNGLDKSAEVLEVSGVIKDFYILIKKSKSLIPSGNLNELLSIIRILSEEIWKEQRKTSSSNITVHTQSKLNSSQLETTKTNKDMKTIDELILSPTSTNRVHSQTRSFSILNSLRKSDSDYFKPQSKYKLSISEEVAYMV